MSTGAASEEQTIWDVAVAGDGIAGLCAAFFAARAGLRTVLHGGVSGGELASIATITNYPGVSSVAGYELCPTLLEQAMDAGAEYAMESVNSLAPADDGFVLTHDGGTTAATTVIVATGTTFGRFGVDGEEELAGRGISHCASCDGPLYPAQVVAVAGSSDYALQEAVTLADMGLEVVVLWTGRDLRPNRHTDKSVLASERITVLEGTRLACIAPNDSGVTIHVDSDRGADTRDVAALFSYPPMVPRSDFVRELVELDSDGFIMTSAQMETSRAGVFAAGSVRSGFLDLAVNAAAEGAIAADSVAKLLLA